MVKSVEPNITELGNGWLKQYGLDYKLEQEPLNAEIDKALSEYFTKNGGRGSNRPDTKLLLQDCNLDYYPILIEYKGYKNKLVKLNDAGIVENANDKNEPNFKNINSYAVNGAIHYANAILHYTSYDNVIAIGMTGYKDDDGKLQHEIGVYYVSKDNYGVGKEIGKFTDFSFLAPENFDNFIQKVNSLSLSTTELETIKEQKEKEIDSVLLKLNNDIYVNEKGLGEDDRIYLVVASIIATLGVPGKVSPLEKSDLKSLTEKGNTDGEIMMRKIKAFLDFKNIPTEKKNLIIRTLQNVLLSENINKVKNGETQLKRVFCKILDDLGIYYKVGLSTDFAGKLFNEMYNWLGFTQDKLNDVVLTPTYIANLLVKLAKINRDSYVWDFATGSAGLLVAAMNEMLADARTNIYSPELLKQKELKIKGEQLLGLELLPNVYMLAILNMILMGDGSSNILNQDSLIEFDGKYGYGKPGVKFPANALILNPPYSAKGNGMIFVEKALSMMDNGYAAIIIQSSTGSGKAIECNRNILKHNTLIASIKMPEDLFIGKANVNTHVYVFKVGEPHNKNEIVKFINFTNDGYVRSNRRKSKNNLQDINNAKDRYNELVDLVYFGKSKLKLIDENDYYEATIDPNNGADWNQVKPINASIDVNMAKQIVESNFAWELSHIIQNKITDDVDNSIMDNVEWGSFKLEDLFKKIKTNKLKYKVSELPKEPTGEYNLPALTASTTNQGLNCYVPRDNATILKNVITITGNGACAVFYQKYEFTVLQDAYAIQWIYSENELTSNQYLFLVSAISKAIVHKYGWSNKSIWNKVKNDSILLPIKNDEIDFEFMDQFIYKFKIGYVNRLKKIYEIYENQI